MGFAFELAGESRCATSRASRRLLTQDTPPCNDSQSSIIECRFHLLQVGVWNVTHTRNLAVFRQISRKEIVTKVSMGSPPWTGLFANIGA